MPWFKVDDGFATSEPVMRVPRRYRASVIGLWTLSGTWCAKELTDGKLPFHMLDELAGTRAQASHLVACGLWADHPAGYVFIGWEKYQPTREKVEADRKREADRKANYRKSQRDTSGTPDGQTEGHQAESGYPDPTRPDPTNKEIEPVQPPVERPPKVDVILAEFEQWWIDYPRKQGRADALKAFRGARKKTSLELLTSGVAEYKLAHIGVDKSKLKMAGGWLRDERWNDEQIIVEAPEIPQSAFHQPQPSAPRPPRAGDGMCRRHPDYPVPCDRCREE